MLVSRIFDSFGRMTAIASVGTGSGTSLLSFTYAYNHTNQHIAVTNDYNSRWAFGYDYLGQVTKGYRYWSDNVPVASQQFFWKELTVKG